MSYRMLYVYVRGVPSFSHAICYRFLVVLNLACIFCKVRPLYVGGYPSCEITHSYPWRRYAKYPIEIHWLELNGHLATWELWIGRKPSSPLRGIYKGFPFVLHWMIYSGRFYSFFSNNAPRIWVYLYQVYLIKQDATWRMIGHCLVKFSARVSVEFGSSRHRAICEQIWRVWSLILQLYNIQVSRTSILAVVPFLLHAVPFGISIGVCADFLISNYQQQICDSFSHHEKLWNSLWCTLDIPSSI